MSDTATELRASMALIQEQRDTIKRLCELLTA